jgi:DNA-binding transcriptional MerR regulator
MTDSQKIRIPESAIAELEAVEEMDWDEGIGLQELIDWINQVVERFRPDFIDDNARSSAAFSSRSFRHYQTLGCIDAPRRAGKSVAYGFKHYLQGLVIRKLLWERVPSEQIATLMAGKDTDQLKRLLLDGIEVVAARTDNAVAEFPSERGTWKRVLLAPGIELHLETSRRALNGDEVETICEKLLQQL